MSAASPFDVQCPTCGELAGRHREWVANDDRKMILSEHNGLMSCHPSRISAAQPKPTDVERFAERLATMVESMPWLTTRDLADRIRRAAKDES